MKFYRCTMGRICADIEVDGNRIVTTPPIWKGWRGRAWSSFKAYYGARLKVEELE